MARPLAEVLGNLEDVIRKSQESRPEKGSLPDYLNQIKPIIEKIGRIGEPDPSQRTTKRDKDTRFLFEESQENQRNKELQEAKARLAGKSPKTPFKSSYDTVGEAKEVKFEPRSFFEMMFGEKAKEAGGRLPPAHTEAEKTKSLKEMREALASNRVKMAQEERQQRLMDRQHQMAYDSQQSLIKQGMVIPEGQRLENPETLRQQQKMQDRLGKASPYLGAAQNLAQQHGGEAGKAFSDLVDIGKLTAQVASGDFKKAPELAVKAIAFQINDFKSSMQHLENAGKHIGGFIRQERLGGMAKEASGAATELAYSVPGPMKYVLGPITDLLMKTNPAVILTGAIDKLRDFSAGLHQANMQFAEFSGDMAKVQAEQNVRDIMLSRERGERRAASAELLAESKHKLERSMAPIEDFAANIKNTIASGFDKAASTFVDANAKMFKQITGIDLTNEGELNKTTQATRKIFEEGQGVNGRMDAYGRPKRFNG